MRIFRKYLSHFGRPWSYRMLYMQRSTRPVRQKARNLASERISASDSLFASPIHPAHPHTIPEDLPDSILVLFLRRTLRFRKSTKEAAFTPFRRYGTTWKTIPFFLFPQQSPTLCTFVGDSSQPAFACIFMTHCRKCCWALCLVKAAIIQLRSPAFCHV